MNLSAEGANEGTPYEGEAVVLAVNSLGPEVKLLDALDVKTDRFTGFWEDRPVFRLDPRNDAFIVYSTHSNAGESYFSLDMLFVDAGRRRPGPQVPEDARGGKVQERARRGRGFRSGDQRQLDN